MLHLTILLKGLQIKSIYIDDFLASSYCIMNFMSNGNSEPKKIMDKISTEEGNHGRKENIWVSVVLSNLEDDMSVYRSLVERSYYLK